MKYSISVLVLSAVVVSFMGWMVENCWLSLTKGYVDNRSMALPFLLGYGLFIVVLYLLIGTPQSLVCVIKGIGKTARRKRVFLYFFLAFILVSLGEIILGTLVEHICGFSYWNYEWIPFHVTRYTSLPTSTGFALGITFFMGKLFLPLLDMLSKLPPKLCDTLALIFGIALTLDFATSFIKMYLHHGLNYYWHIKVGRPVISLRLRSVQQ